jgi:hypothetical protein
MHWCVNKITAICNLKNILGVSGAIRAAKIHKSEWMIEKELVEKLTHDLDMMNVKVDF